MISKIFDKFDTKDDDEDENESLLIERNFDKEKNYYNYHSEYVYFVFIAD